MGGLYQVALKFWAHCKVNPAPRKTLLFIFLWFFPDFWFPKDRYWSGLECRKEKIKAGLIYGLHAVVCVKQCVKFVLLSFGYVNGYLSEICGFRVLDIER